MEGVKEEPAEEVDDEGGAAETLSRLAVRPPEVVRRLFGGMKCSKRSPTPLFSRE